MSTTIPTGTGLLESPPQPAPAAASKTTYGQLVSALADLEPRYGWNAGDLPPLTNADVRAICAARRDRVLEELDMSDVIDAVAAGSDNIGLVLDALHRACREAVFFDVERECEEREEERLREGRQESAESALGVVGLFRDSHLG